MKRLIYLFLWIAVVSCVNIPKEFSISELAARIEELENICKTQHALMEDQAAKIQQIEQDVRHQNILIDQFSKDVTAQLRFVNLTRTGLQRKPRNVDLTRPTIAFHATIKGNNHLEHMDIGQTIIFKDVLLNLGGCYYSRHGLFVAKIEGIYIFSVSINALLASGSDGVMVFIMKNGIEVTSAIADARNSYADQGSTTAVMKLAIGDEVWVSIQRHNDVAIWTDSLSSFMGVLVA